MDFDFKVEKEFLRVRVEGVRNPENVLAIAELTTSRCAELGVSRALIDVREMIGGLSTFESHKFSAQELPRLRDLSHFNRAAIVDLPENEIRFVFLEQVAQNRGLGLRFFCDEASALDWLLEDAQKS